MSDRPLSDDWWLASDGKWYPPQSRRHSSPATGPTAHAMREQPPPIRRYTSFRFTMTTALVLLGFALVEAATAVIVWTSGDRWVDQLSFEFSEAAFEAGLSTGAFIAILVLMVFGLISLAVIGVTAFWFRSAYISAESRGATRTSWSSGWAVGSWFIPMASYVIPKLVVNEIDRMSRSELVEPIRDSWKGMSRSIVSDWWWGVFWVAMAMQTVAYMILTLGGPVLLLVSVSILLTAVAHVLAAITVLDIGKRLTRT